MRYSVENKAGLCGPVKISVGWCRVGCWKWIAGRGRDWAQETASQAFEYQPVQTSSITPSLWKHNWYDLNLKPNYWPEKLRTRTGLCRDQVRHWPTIFHWCWQGSPSSFLNCPRFHMKQECPLFKSLPVPWTGVCELLGHSNLEHQSLLYNSEFLFFLFYWQVCFGFFQIYSKTWHPIINHELISLQQVLAPK